MKTPAWQRKEGKRRNTCGCATMVECNAVTLTSFVWPGIPPQLFAQSVDKTSRLQHTTPTASAGTEQQDIVRIVKSAALKGVGKIGQGPFTRLSLQQAHKPAKFAMLTSRLQNFMQTVVLRMVQKNTAVGAKAAYSQEQNKNSQKRTHQKHSGGRPAQKTLSPASLITRQNASSILDLTSTLSTFFNFMRNSKVAAPCLELK